MGYLIFTPDPRGAQGGPRGIPRGQGHYKMFSPNQQMLLIKVVTYASVMTKMHSGSSLDLPGPSGTRGCPRGHSKSWSNEKMLLKKLSGKYASMMKKNHLLHPHGLTPWRSLWKALVIFHEDVPTKHEHWLIGPAL